MSISKSHKKMLLETPRWLPLGVPRRQRGGVLPGARRWSRNRRLVDVIGGQVQRRAPQSS